MLEPATEFLLNFNDDEFNIQVRARDYYSFVALTTIADGPPVPGAGGDPGGHAARDHDAREAARATAATRFSDARCWRPLLPTIDPVTMILEMIPLVVLYELAYPARERRRPPAASGVGG